MFNFPLGLARTFMPPRFNKPRIGLGNTIAPTELDDQEQQPPDFASEYNKLNSNTPNRLAYRDAVRSGPPPVSLTKKTRIAAILGGIAGGFSGGPGAGAGIANSILSQPLEQSDSDYDKKVKGLQSLSNQESEDLDRNLKSLDTRADLYYKGRTAKREDTAEARQGKVADATISNMEADNERQNWVEWDDESSGNRLAYNRKTGESKTLGKSGTPDSTKHAWEMDKQKTDNTAAMARTQAQEAGANSRNEKTVNASLTNTQVRADATRQNTVARLTKAANAMKPGDKGKQALLDITQEVSTNPALADINPDDYLDISPEGILSVKPSGWLGDSEEKTAIKGILKNIIDKSLTKSNTTPSSTKGSVSLPSGWVMK